MKPIYNSKGWVLGRCKGCGTLNYVEPHGTTAVCNGKSHNKARWTEHESIDYSERDFSGNFYLGKKAS